MPKDSHSDCGSRGGGCQAREGETEAVAWVRREDGRRFCHYPRREAQTQREETENEYCHCLPTRSNAVVQDWRWEGQAKA